MGNAWCKLWNFFLSAFTDVVDGVGYALAKAGEIAGDVLTNVAAGVGNAVGSIFGGGNLLVWVVLGVGAYFFLKDDNNASNRPYDRGGDRLA